MPRDPPVRGSMISALVIGLLAAFLATTLAAALRRAPTRVRCPACGASTVPVRPEAWLLKRMPDIRLRWCQACSWQGWGRNGAEWIAGHPASHDSGFRWGSDRFPEDWGFRFADQSSTETSVEPPDHPSGFRFSTPPRQGPRAHPSGFAWADADRDPTDSADQPASFRWASPSSERDAGFAWGERAGRPSRPPRKGFTWKDAG